MRVAIVVKEFPPDSIGGLQTQTKRMATALAESDEGPDVVLLTKRYRRHENDAELPFEVIRVPQLGMSPFISDLTFLAGCFLALVWYSRRIDVMQCMTIYPIGFLGLMVNRLSGVPYFAWIRGNDFYQMRNVWWKRWMIRRVLDDTRVLVQSEEIETDVREYFPDLDPDIGVLGNGVTVPDEHAEGDGDVVLFVGRLAPKKGVEYLIKAMADVRIEAKLWIVGDGNRRAALEELANKLAINVQFYGEIDPHEINWFYRNASVFVLPSVEGEGMPNAVLEAMAHGLPVVATDSGGIPSVIADGDTGFVVPMREAEALAFRIDQLLEDTTMRRNIGENARTYVREKRSWRVLVQKLKAEFEKIAN